MKNRMTVWVAAVMAVILGTVSVGCNAKEALKAVVVRTYDTTVQIETYVNAVDVSEIIERIKSIEAPLKITANALRFISDRVKDQEIKDAMKNVAATIDNIVMLVNSADASQAEFVKEQVNATLNRAQEVLVQIGSYLGLDLETRVQKSIVEKNEIFLMTEELEQMIK